MDSFELNKIAGAVLFALLVGFGVSILSDILFTIPEPETPGYVIAVVETEAGEPVADQATPLPVLLASADPAAGEATARPCAACHTFEEGGASRIGPNLWNIINLPIAEEEGYAYSPALEQLGAAGEIWDFENMAAFLRNPQAFAPGTKMTYAGLRRDDQLANVLAYLRTLSHDPAPLPEVVAEVVEDPGAPVVEIAAPDTTEEPAAVTGDAPAQPGNGVQEGQVQAPTAPTGMEMQNAGGGTSAVVIPDTQQVQTGMGGEQPVAPELGAVQDGQPVAPEGEQPAAGILDATGARATEQPPPPEQPAPDQQGQAPAQEPAQELAPEQQAAAAPAEAAPAEAAAPASGFAALVAQADLAAGEASARKCVACHTFTEGGPNRVGPNLWNTVNQPVANAEGYAYSQAMLDFAEGGRRLWTVDELDGFLENPTAHVPRTKMVFAGIRQEQERAALIAYIHSLSNDPAPLQ